MTRIIRKEPLILMALFLFKELERIKIKLIDIVSEYQNENNDIILNILDKFKFSKKKLSNKLKSKSDL
ncbi:hypothetical protein [Faecalimicrobium sp. JNUCC 81]